MRLPLFLALIPLPVLAEIQVHHPVAVRAYQAAPTGAAYMILVNTGEADDRLLSVAADLAERAEVHATVRNADGTMGMEPQDGLVVPGGAGTELAPGGLHIMLLGLSPGEEVTLTLTFEEAGEITVAAPWGTPDDAAGRSMHHDGPMDHGGTDHAD